jgi:hypothetical protein
VIYSVLAKRSGGAHDQVNLANTLSRKRNLFKEQDTLDGEIGEILSLPETRYIVEWLTPNMLIRDGSGQADKVFDSTE